MNNTTFVHVSYIATTAERLWSALTVPDVTREWYRVRATPLENLSEWTRGAAWIRRQLENPPVVDIAGIVLEVFPPRRLVLTWQRPRLADTPPSHLSFDIAPVGARLVRLTITHDRLDPVMFDGVSAGWPKVLSNLKTFLETGSQLPDAGSMWSVT